MGCVSIEKGVENTHQTGFTDFSKAVQAKRKEERRRKKGKLLYHMLYICYYMIYYTIYRIIEAMPNPRTKEKEKILAIVLMKIIIEHVHKQGPEVT